MDLEFCKLLLQQLKCGRGERKFVSCKKEDLKEGNGGDLNPCGKAPTSQKSKDVDIMLTIRQQKNNGSIAGFMTSGWTPRSIRGEGEGER